MPPMASYLAKIKSMRESLGISQKEMAEWLGMSRENYNSSENGRSQKTITEDRLPRIAEHPKVKAAGITLATLRAWMRLDGATPEEERAIYLELVSSSKVEIPQALKERIAADPEAVRRAFLEADKDRPGK